MSCRFALVTIGLAPVVRFMAGVTVAGPLNPGPTVSGQLLHLHGPGSVRTLRTVRVDGP